jgi:4-amino-4-deoxy-L-arabinose transferase-like glycosyltransferase
MNISIFAVMILAIFFRLWRVSELMVFSGETNNLFYYLSSYLAGEKPWLLGLEAAQYVHHLFHLPWYLWMMIPVYLAGGGDPLIFAVLHAVIGAASAYFLYRALMLLGSPGIGLLSAFGYAVFLPVANIERFISPVSLVPFGTIMTFYFLVLSHQRQKHVWFLLLGFWLGVTVSFHYAMLLTVAVILGWVWWRNRKFFVASILGVVLAFSPMIIFDLRHNFFNLTGLWLVAKSLAGETRPYGSSHFLFQIYPAIIIFIALLISRLPKRVLPVICGVFLLIQLRALSVYKIHPNLMDRYLVVDELFSQWDQGLTVYFRGQSSFDYAYLLRLEARKRNLNQNKIVIFEPWQPENNAGLIVENNTVKFSQEGE